MPAFGIEGVLLGDMVEPECGLSDSLQALLEKLDFFILFPFLLFSVIWVKLEAVDVSLDVASVEL